MNFKKIVFLSFIFLINSFLFSQEVGLINSQDSEIYLESEQSIQQNQGFIPENDIDLEDFNKNESELIETQQNTLEENPSESNLSENYPSEEITNTLSEFSTTESESIIFESVEVNDEKENQQTDSIEIDNKIKTSTTVKESKTKKSIDDSGVEWLIDKWGNFQPQHPRAIVDEFAIYDLVNSEENRKVSDDKFTTLLELNGLQISDYYNIDFSTGKDFILISPENAWYNETFYNKNNKPLEIAKSFISSYMTTGTISEDLIGYADDAAAVFEVCLDTNAPDSIKSFNNYKIYLYPYYEEDPYKVNILAGIEGNVSGKPTKEIFIIKMNYNDEQWAVINIFNGLLSFYYSKYLNS